MTREYLIPHYRDVVDNRNTAIHMKLENIGKVVMTCTLHNFLRNRRDYYIPATYFDVEDTDAGGIHFVLRPEPNTLLDLQNGAERHASAQASRFQELFMNYFTNEGSVWWYETLSNCVLLMHVINWK